MTAIILVETAIGKARAVLGVLRKITGVVEVSAYTWPYDIIATVRAEDSGKLEALVNKSIRSVEGITRITPCLKVNLE